MKFCLKEGERCGREGREGRKVSYSIKKKYPTSRVEHQLGKWGFLRKGIFPYTKGEGGGALWKRGKRTGAISHLEEKKKKN